MRSSWRFEFESEYVEVRPGRALKSSKIILLQFHIPYHTILFQNGKQLSNHYTQIRICKCRMYPVIKFNNLDCSLGKFNQAHIGDTSTESQYHVPNIATNKQQTTSAHTISVINSAFLCDFCQLNLKPKESKESTFIHFALWLCQGGRHFQRRHRAAHSLSSNNQQSKGGGGHCFQLTLSHAMGNK